MVLIRNRDDGEKVVRESVGIVESGLSTMPPFRSTLCVI